MDTIEVNELQQRPKKATEACYPNLHIQKSSYSYQDLLDCAHGKLFGLGNARLPLPPMLMFDRISFIDSKQGKYNNGTLTAELDITPDLWFFSCHFEEDPVMPGCLGLDAMWQLIGFYLGWLGNPGRGRALGGESIKFSGQITPDKKLVQYKIDIIKIISRSMTLGIADAELACDGEIIYTAKNLKVGLFTAI